MRDRRNFGFTLIELLVTVAILGILVAIAVVNYRNAIDRARQRRSMSDMRGIASAMEAYAADFDRYPPSAGLTLPDGLDLPTQSLLLARPYIQPTYLLHLPVADGWNSWFLYATTTSSSDFALRSAGLGGEPQTAPAGGPTTDFRDDIILVNGQFVQWPDGAQK
jgi:type II secretion system protein G